jgi:hypothetical protein
MPSSSCRCSTMPSCTIGSFPSAQTQPRISNLPMQSARQRSSSPCRMRAHDSQVSAFHRTPPAAPHVPRTPSPPSDARFVELAFKACRLVPPPPPLTPCTNQMTTLLRALTLCNTSPRSSAARRSSSQSSSSLRALLSARSCACVFSRAVKCNAVLRTLAFCNTLLHALKYCNTFAVSSSMSCVPPVSATLT